MSINLSFSPVYPHAVLPFHPAILLWVNDNLPTSE